MNDAIVEQTASYLSSIADVLRGDYRPSDQESLILSFTVLRRLDCVIAPSRSKLLVTSESGQPLESAAPRPGVWATSPDDLRRLCDVAPTDLLSRFLDYLQAFSPEVLAVLEPFQLRAAAMNLERLNLLTPLVRKFAEADLTLESVSDLEMGYVYDEIVRRFSEANAELGGEHLTPRDVVELMSRLVVGESNRGSPAAPPSVYDPTCGTGSNLVSVAAHVRRVSGEAELRLVGQDLNPGTVAVARARMLMSGRTAAEIELGDTLIADAFEGTTFDYLLANPPFGVEWKKVKDDVTAEHETMGFAGRFGAGLPRINDGSFLFLQHMISKMKRPEEGGSRLAIVFNGSPLFTGAAGSGESEIRRWIIENDWLEAVVALPDQLFYNTGISTYLLVLTNAKESARSGSVQIIDARGEGSRLRRVLGSKRTQITNSGIDRIVAAHQTYGASGADARTLQNSELLASPQGELEPWMFIAGLERDDFVSLSDYAQRPARVDAKDLPRLRASDLVPGVTADDLVRSDDSSGRRLAECVGGDIVGVGGRYSALPLDFGRAATQLEVLRLPPELAANAELLALWLSSDEAKGVALDGSTIPRISPSALVPRELVEDVSLGEAARQLNEARRNVTSLVDTLFPVWPAAIGGSTRGQELKAIAANARGVAELLRPLSDVLHRAEAEYPYQIAKLARDYRLATDLSVQLEAGMKLAESILRTIGVVSMSAASATGELPADLKAQFQGGISGGGWFHVIRLALDHGAAEAAPVLGSFTTKKRSPGKALEEVISRRNAVHHSAGVVADVEKAELLSEIDERLSAALDGFAYLASLEFVNVAESRFTEAGNFQNSVQRLNGSHPDWETGRIETSDPVTPRQLYVRVPDASSWLPMRGLAAVEVCGECRRDELYVLDRIQGRTRTLKSLRGHSIQQDRP